MILTVFKKKKSSFLLKEYVIFNFLQRSWIVLQVDIWPQIITSQEVLKIFFKVNKISIKAFK